MGAFFKRIAIVMSALALSLQPASSVLAEATVQEYACTVEYKVDNKATAISGAEFSFARVATGDKSKGVYLYTYEDDFKDSKYDPNELAKSGDDTKTIAKAYKDMYKSGAEVKTTDGNGACTFTTKTPGLYLVWQTNSKDAASRYQTADPMIVFLPCIDSDNVTWKNSVTIEPKTSRIPETSTTTSTGAISVYKVDADDQTKYLEGAEFSLYHSDGTIVGKYKTDKKGYFGVSWLEYGDYYLIETKAPEGYVCGSDKIPFTLNASTSYSNDYPWNIKVTNTKGTPADKQKENTPDVKDKRTGDASNLPLYLAAGGIGIVSLALVLRKKKI